MSFRATIRNREKQSIWFRTISSLSSLHENINFTLTSQSLIAWSMNSTDTSLCHAVFEKNIFDEFEFLPGEIVFGESGLQIVTDGKGIDHWLYSFQTNGKHLTTISKNMDNDSIDRFTLIINNTANCPENLTNRLIVLVEMETLITKEYSPQFQPIKYDPIIINLKYKKKFLNVYSNFPSVENPLDPKLLNVFVQTDKELSDTIFNINLDSGIENRDKLTSADEINYICCHQLILRNFLENCNSNITEELKLEININKFLITAFTKAIYGKNNDLLRNAISMSNTISTSNLEHYCLFTTVDDANNDEENMATDKKNNSTKKSITFKLKQFKNFINILASQKNYNFNNDTVNIWFCHPGDPILMEINVPGVRLELVQVTDGNNQTVKEAPNIPVKIAISPDKRIFSGKTIANNNFEQHNMSSKINHTESPLKNKIDNNFFDPTLNFGTANSTPASPIKNQIERRPVGIPKSPTKPSSMRSLFINQFSQESSESGAILSNALKPHDSKVSSHTPTTRNEANAQIAQRGSTIVGWGKRPILDNNDSNLDTSTPAAKKMNTKETIKEEKMNFINKINKNETNEQNLELAEHGLGPTQQDAVKGIFD